MEQTLLLNATYEPLKVVHWQKAVTLWCQGKVEVVKVYDREIHAVSFSFKLPSVIRLLRYIKIKRRFDYVPFSRANIYARDEYECQYCGDAFSTNELTFDHVQPVAQGGRKDWENIVTCCVTCNRKKGGRTPAEAGMSLRSMSGRRLRQACIRSTTRCSIATEIFTSPTAARAGSRCPSRFFACGPAGRENRSRPASSIPRRWRSIVTDACMCRAGSRARCTA